MTRTPLRPLCSPAVVALMSILALPLTLVAPAAVVAAEVEVRLTDRLGPASLTVAPGTTVVFVNDSPTRHRLRSADHSGGADWDTGDIDRGERARVTFSREGVFAYVDERDRDDVAFHGTITVQAGPPAGPSGGSTPGADGPTTTGGGTSRAAGGAVPAGTVPATVRVVIADEAFGPAAVEIRAGGTVTWTNRDDRPHTASARDAAWGSPILASGGVFSQAFATPGRFAYLCQVHPDMQGTVLVVAAAAGPTGAPAARPGVEAPAATAAPASTAAPTAPALTPDAAAPSAAGSAPPLAPDVASVVRPGQPTASGAPGNPAGAATTRSASGAEFSAAGRGGLVLLVTAVAAAAFARVLRGTVRSD